MDKTITTPPFTSSFPALFQPVADAKYYGGEPMYKVRAIFAKSADLSKVKAKIEEVANERWGQNRPRNFAIPLIASDTLANNDGVLPPGHEAGGHYMNLKSKYPVGLVKGKDRQKILDEEEIYSGCKGIASINFKTYDEGVSVYIEHFWKIGDGEKLVGVAPEDRFAAITLPDDEMFS